MCQFHADGFFLLLQMQFGSSFDLVVFQVRGWFVKVPIFYLYKVQCFTANTSAMCQLHADGFFLLLQTQFDNLGQVFLGLCFRFRDGL